MSRGCLNLNVRRAGIAVRSFFYFPLGGTSFAGAFAGIAILIAAIVSLDTASAQTPTPGILAPGNAIVTGFSGAPLPDLVAPGDDPGDQTFIDPNGPAARVFDLRVPGAPPQAQVIPAPNPFSVTAAQVGQVFGVALDSATPPNIAAQIYTPATMTKMIAHCTQGGESIDQAIAWGADELEGFMRG